LLSAAEVREGGGGREEDDTEVGGAAEEVEVRPEEVDGCFRNDRLAT